jgi:diguanylate cyclase (GGDEF)-like protein
MAAVSDPDRARDSDLSPKGGADSRTPAIADEILDPRLVLSSIGEVVYSWDLDSDDLSWGPNAADLLVAVPAGALTKGLGFARLTEPGSGRSRHDAIIDSLGTDLGEGVVYRTRYAAMLGRLMWIEDTGRWFGGPDGRPARAHGIIRIERPVRDGELNTVAHELCDRPGLVAAIEAALAEHLPARRNVAVLVTTIDELAQLNDSLGNEATDEIIATVQDRLRTVMRGRDRLVRYSGSRFAILLVGCPASQLEAAARRFIRAVSRAAIETASGIALVHLRLGAAQSPTTSATAGALLAAAEQALARARRGTLDTPVIATSAGGPPARALASSVETVAIQSLNDRRVRLALQPVACARSRVARFHEALLRVEKGEGRFFAPAELVPVLETLGLVQLFDSRVVELAADLLAAERQLVLSVNVSPRSLADPAWLAAFLARGSLTRGLFERLIVEITETATIEDPVATAVTLRRIKDTGARIAIDDFGAGHTSMRHLRTFPIDILKLDGAFTQNLQRSTDDRFFVKTLIELARHLGVETVAEWVDDPAVAQLLTDWGITYLQGNLFGEARLWAKPGTTPPLAAIA